MLGMYIQHSSLSVCICIIMITYCCTERVTIVHVVCSKPQRWRFQATLTDIFLNANVIYVQLACEHGLHNTCHQRMLFR